MTRLIGTALNAGILLRIEFGADKHIGLMIMGLRRKSSSVSDQPRVIPNLLQVLLSNLARCTMMPLRC